MKILCSLSGLEFNCDYFPGTFYSREATHPIFHIPQAKLLNYLGKWGAGELTHTDSYLLILALLNSSDLVDFRTAVYKTEQTDSIVAQNMEPLARILIHMNTVRDTSLIFPRFVISPETRNLATLKSWIETWQECYADFVSGYTSAHDSQKLIARENALEKLIKSQHKTIDSYSGQLGEWAALAGKFPLGSIPNPFTRQQSTLADYWKTLINKCSKGEAMYGIPKQDIEELLEHCETEIDAGSIYSNALFKVLRNALAKQGEFLGLGVLDMSKVTYQLLTEDTSAEAANMRRVIDNAPASAPTKESYPTKFAYFQAKLRWDMAQQLKKAQGTQPPIEPKDPEDNNNDDEGEFV